MNPESSERAPPFVGLLGVVLSLLSGCATRESIHSVLPTETLRQITATEVRAYIPQNGIEFEYKPTGYGAGFGLGGGIVDLVVNSSKSASAGGYAKRLGTEVADFDFRAGYWTAVSNVVAETQWLKLQAFQRMPSPVVPIKPAAVMSNSVLNIGTEYSITPDHRVFKLRTGLYFYLLGKHKHPTGLAEVSYFSAEIVTAAEKPLDVWMANHGEVYRRVTTEGVEESAKLVRYALNLLGGASIPTARPAKVRAKLARGRDMFGLPEGRAGLKGTVLEETGERMIFQADGGTIFSFPRKEIEVAFLAPK
jgi:hypothetical protein